MVLLEEKMSAFDMIFILYDTFLLLRSKYCLKKTAFFLPTHIGREEHLRQNFSSLGEPIFFEGQ